MTNYIWNLASATLYVYVSDNESVLRRQTEQVRKNIPPNHPNSGLRHSAETAMYLGFFEVHPGEPYQWRHGESTKYISILFNNGRRHPDSARLLCDTTPNPAKNSFIVDKNEQLCSTTDELPIHFVRPTEELHDIASTSKKANRPVSPVWFSYSKEQDKSKILSAEVCGRRSLKSFWGTYLRQYGINSEVDMRDGPAEWCEQWNVEDRNGKVVFKTCRHEQYLSARPDGKLGLAEKTGESEMWTPSRNQEEGSWSFLSFDGKYLRANKDNSADLAPHCSVYEQFWLQSW